MLCANQSSQDRNTVAVKRLMCFRLKPHRFEPIPAGVFLWRQVRQLSLVCSLIVFVCPQMAGKWYLIGFATNAQWFVSRRDTMKMGTSVFTPTADGDVDISYASLNSDGSCWRLNNLATKTDIPGKFTYTSQRWGSLNDMRFVEVKSDEYALTQTIKSKGSELTVVNKLYGRAADLSNDLLVKFKQFSLDSGVLPENIVFLPKNASDSAFSH
uniref:Zgc:153704 n=1 Tax=Salarias fasciatus TaxID=181472 RepID=A0A672GX78_SALFA